MYAFGMRADDDDDRKRWRDVAEDVVLPATVRLELIKNHRFACVVSLLVDRAEGHLDPWSACAAWEAAGPFLRPADVQRQCAVRKPAAGMLADRRFARLSEADHESLVWMVVQMWAACAGADACARALGARHRAGARAAPRPRRR